MFHDAVLLIDQLRVKLETGNLTRTRNEGYDQGME